MRDLSVKDKKQIISRLAKAYQETTLSPEAALRIGQQLKTRIVTKHVSHRLTDMRYAWLFAGALIILAGIVVIWMWIQRDLNVPGPSSVAVTGVEGVVTTGDGEQLRTDTPIANGETLRTRQNSQVVLELGAHQVTVAQQSGIILENTDRSHLRFRVTRGKSIFKVAKLHRNETLQVVSGDVTVHVVGTQFSVEKIDACVSVAVFEGRVRTEIGGVDTFVSAGQSNRYCPSLKNADTTEEKRVSVLEKNATMIPQTPAETTVPSEPEQPPLVSKETEFEEGQQSSGARREKSAQNAASLAFDDAMVETDIPIPVHGHGVGSDSEEVLLFDNAHRALTKGVLPAASKMFQEYLASYPSGIFSEDAAFRLVRIAFRQRNSSGVMDWSERFLARFGNAASHRSAEVRILRARFLIRQQRYGAALRVLQPLTNTLNRRTPIHRHQIAALRFTAACGARHEPLCSDLAKRYLQNWPNGAFAAHARQFSTVPE
ncbi:MAG: FecR domain-containing protein [Deltaproteobacteria bacterium]|nr:FecR domain-containing protein [Deltaproteobacteria bacterium]